MNKSLLRIAPAVAAVLLLAGCSTPKNLLYLQDVKNGSQIHTVPSSPIRLKPMDQISIVVTGLDPVVSAMFNLPYYTRQLGAVQSTSGGSGNMGGGLPGSGQGMSSYTVDSQGNIDFPVLGKIYVQGKTRAETSEYVKQLLIDSKQIKNPIVTVEFMNLGFSVLGEVSSPGRYRIDRDEFTVFDAISLAGDLTINGHRHDIMLIRDSGTDREQVYTFDITKSYDVYSSPAYYIQQGDIIYVTPSQKRLRESTIMGNAALTPSFWISIVSSATSIATSVISIALLITK